MCVFLLPCNPLPPSTNTYIHHTHASAETGFSIFYIHEHNSFTKSFLNFLLQINNLLFIFPRILRNKYCQYKQKINLGKEGPCCNVPPFHHRKKASGFVKPKQKKGRTLIFCSPCHELTSRDVLTPLSSGLLDESTHSED